MRYILTIREHNHSWAGRGPVQTTHSTAEEAHASLRDYVARNWDSEVGTERPDDPEHMIREYFSEVPEAYDVCKSE